jgi:hypothetical protein
MPKRFGKRERWRRKMFRKYNPPEVIAFRRAMYDPHFARALHTWARCQRREGDTLALAVWCEFAEYCLDRPEID